MKRICWYLVSVPSLLLTLGLGIVGIATIPIGIGLVLIYLPFLIAEAFERFAERFFPELLEEADREKLQTPLGSLSPLIMDWN
jgi:Na+-transporting methylmalonyl-CoA/oxaloacetate decarboxylase gamma subunit